MVKQATKGQKEIYLENKKTILQYSIAASISSALYILECLVLGTGTTTSHVLFGVTIVLHALSLGFMRRLSASKLDEKGHVIDAGADLNDPDAFGEYCKDIVILTVISQVVALYSNYGYLLLLALPAAAGYKIFFGFILPYLTAPSEQPEFDDKKQRKMERRREKPHLFTISNQIHTNLMNESPIRTLRENDVLAICRELANIVRFGEKSVQYARLVIQNVFKNRSIDLCGILPPQSQFNNTPEHPFNVIFEIIGDKSVFFETLLESDEILANDLWDAVIAQCDVSHMAPADSQTSVLMHAISKYVMRLLPTEQPVSEKVMTPSHHHAQQRIRTPLQLIRSNSPLMNKFKLEERTQLLNNTASAAFQPRYVTLFCSLLIKACSTEKFPTPNRLLLLRFFLKQFHIFCLYDTGDADVDGMKNALLIQPPFASHVYSFLLHSIEQCPTVFIFKDIVLCWLTYTRPWRYLPGEENITHTRFMPFAKENYDFYRILLGKIFKRYMEFGASLETLNNMKAVIEFAWKEPNCVVLRQLGLDVQPHVTSLLTEMQRVMLLAKESIKTIEKQHSGFFGSFFSVPPPELASSRQLVQQIESLLRESDQAIGTKFTRPDVKPMNPTEARIAAMNQTILDETPKSALLPDHFIDHRTNLMILSPLGRKQVINGERKFDFSRCPKSSRTRDDEISYLGDWFDSAALWLSRSPLVTSLGRHYNESSALGALARTVMYPPVPNTRKESLSPVYASRLRVVPPILKLRLLATRPWAFGMVFLFMWLLYGYVFLIPAGFLFLILVATSISAQQPEI
ncbi:unnamed protein product [Caenorhabditis auriculariae]|uniref:Transmembrane protein 208 n=1 Tax=Caenorhabditis auriculariae TaxID=2777116 RepID=A0A8S1HQX4_9PELO|nr:unnamed protein product [Caenorhabditis auriculariae]